MEVDSDIFYELFTSSHQGCFSRPRNVMVSDCRLIFLINEFLSLFSTKGKLSCNSFPVLVTKLYAHIHYFLNLRLLLFSCFTLLDKLFNPGVFYHSCDVRHIWINQFVKYCKTGNQEQPQVQEAVDVYCQLSFTMQCYVFS